MALVLRNARPNTQEIYLLADKNKFAAVADRLLNADQDIMEDMARRMADGEHVRPETDKEKQCMQIICDLDGVAGNVKGTKMTRMYMNNEIWSLISAKGASSWYITLSPVDTRHPLSIYYTLQHGKLEQINALPKNECTWKIIDNPVAAARFFNFVCNLFIEEVLRCKEENK
ncbi:hypothetical protein ARMSODRAFT_989545 [Armillaria solidipes]|uniref:Helitron helicase-like domain-containing protein n=1 Tax=Armillaria solidipes TaxID=1076256 RepID=A0A2H3B947_9AGAR|nr:hypothetical protein ARMSODRAFT_989545 [Armillaria solidipes]